MGSEMCIRDRSWGPFQLARVFARGVHVGWGAACGRHHEPGGAGSLQCKKQATFGKEALSDADCRAKLKRWLLAGLSLPDGSRSWHVNLDARQLAGSSREDLDAEMQAELPA